MATFQDEDAKATAAAAWQRVQELVAVNKTVEVMRRTVDGETQLFLRVWTGKRADGSNKLGADPDADY